MGSVNASHNKNVELLEQKIDELKESLSLAKSEGDKVKVGCRLCLVACALPTLPFTSFFIILSLPSTIPSIGRASVYKERTGNFK